MQSTFKTLAKQAKQRIKSGYWEKSFQEKSESIKLAKSNGVNESAVTKYYREKVISDLKNKNTEEEFFYQKVKTHVKILMKNEWRIYNGEEMCYAKEKTKGANCGSSADWLPSM